MTNIFQPARRLRSDKLLSLTYHCPECNTLMHATGYMQIDTNSTLWSIEYYCPTDKEIFPIYTPETDPIAQQIAHEIDAAEGASSA